MTDPVMTLFPPVPTEDETEHAARATALASLRATMAEASRVGAAADHAGHAAPGVRAPRRFLARRRRWLLIPAALVVAAVAVALVTGLDEGRVAPSPAVALLDRAAAAARRGPTQAIAPDEYLYVRRLVVQRQDGRTERTLFEDWTARDGSGRGRLTPMSAASPAADDRKRPPNPEHAFPYWVGSEGFSYAAVRALPTDPAALELVLRKQAHAPGTSGVSNLRLFETIATLLGGAPLDPAQRAALYHVTADLPGVRRSGAASVTAEGTARGIHLKFTMDCDPATGALLATHTRVSGKLAYTYDVTYELAVRRSTRA